MVPELTRKQKAELRKLHALAWQRDLDRELAILEESFASWRAGTIDAFDLTDIIHQFHNGRQRELYSFYSSRNNPFAVPAAIAKGLISESEVSSELLEKLRFSIEDIRDAIRERPDR